MHALPHLSPLDWLALVTFFACWGGYAWFSEHSRGGAHGLNSTTQHYLLKLKRFADSEAEVIDFEELMHNQNEATINETGHTERSTKQDGLIPAGMLGALVVRDIHSGVEFKIGTGLTAAERQKFWNLRAFLRGALVKYQYFPTGSKEKPRFPSFQGFRPRIDL